MPITLTASPLPLQRDLFDLPDDVTYLNCAYMSPMLKSVRLAGEEGLLRKNHPWTLGADMFFTDCEALRPLVGKLWGTDAEHIAIVASASYGLATAALNIEPYLKAGQEIIVLAEQFPSNYYVWAELAKRKQLTLRVVPMPHDGNWTDAILATLSEKTALLALPNTHWTDGTWIDLSRIRQTIGQGEDAPFLVLDLTQSVGAVPFDVKTCQPDFVASAAYKWAMGPYGMGVLYVADRFLDGTPLEMNWVNRKRSENLARLVDYCDEFQPGARRFDVGERSNPIQLPMAVAAFAQLIDWQPERTLATIRVMTERLAEHAKTLGLHCASTEHRAGHMIGLHAEERWPDDLREAMREANIHVSYRGSGMRVSPHVYNTVEEVDRLAEFLEHHRK